jgi:glutathione S-transferase
VCTLVKARPDRFDKSVDNQGISMENATLIVLIALMQYTWFTVRVGANRGKYNIDAPACKGDEAWERLFRVQQNTLEQLIVFIPAAFAFAYYLSGTWVLAAGATFIIGRFLYSAKYLKDPKTRAPGMLLTMGANAVLVVGGLAGVLIRMF